MKVAVVKSIKPILKNPLKKPNASLPISEFEYSYSAIKV
jgi:hypothetical protein